jgi:hypothetical protein
MNTLEKEFVPYEQALALKELGFDEPCFGWYASDKSLIKDYVIKMNLKAPTFSQAFRWFRERYGLFYYVTTHDSTDFEWYVYDKDQNEWEDDTTQNTYEEAELACLKKLIEIANEQK